MKVLTISQLKRVQYALLLLIIVGPLLLNGVMSYPRLSTWFQAFAIAVGAIYVFYQLKIQGQAKEIKNRLIRTLCLLLLTFVCVTLFNKFYAKPKVEAILNRGK